MAKSVIGVDVGGTFTDCVLYDFESGRIFTSKVATTPDDPSQGIIDSIEKLFQEHGKHISPKDVARVVHGTTLVANAMIERKGAKAGLLATEGFRDILEIGLGLRYDHYDLFLENPEPLAPRPLRLEVKERMDAEGKVVVPLDLGSAREAARKLRDAGAQSVAVCFLHAHINPAHEQAVEALIKREFPDLEVSASSRIAPEIREYERMSTTVANAYVKPLMRRYLRALEDKLKALKLNSPLYIMLSGGGICSVDFASESPIRLIESGPAAGSIASSRYAIMAGAKNAMSFDMGGTTAKMCLIIDGKATRANDFETARLQRFKKGSGLPLKVPVVEMIEIGAGGGSIAHIDAMGLMKVGPESTGAQPGPACYGRGGVLPTVTDADLVLGYLDAGSFLGGKQRLDVEAATLAIESKLAKQLKISVPEAAAGIYRIVNDNMAQATRIHAAERGQDIRQLGLVAFGGAGPVHAYAMARLLGQRRLIVPPSAGVLSALGMVVAPMMVELSQTYVARLNTIDWDRLSEVYRDLEAKAQEQLAQFGAPADMVTLTRTADMRYKGQGYEIPVAIPSGKISKAMQDTITASYNATYQRLFNRHSDDVPIESVNWRLIATVAQEEAGFKFMAFGGDGRKDPLKGHRRAFFEEAKGFVETPVYDRYAMKPGPALIGPALIEETETTVVIGPEARIEVDEHLDLIVTSPHS